MDEKTVSFLNLMFKPDETVCVSHNKYGYHSIPLKNATNGPVVLVPPDSTREYERPKPEELTLVSLNPIRGFRQDMNCTAFRNFLVEMDYGLLKDQLTYIKKIGMPYSAVVFSGNKSLHFLISLEQDLPNENVYRFLAEWTLGIVSLADKNTKNPSRSIRLPGALREPGKKQLLVEMHDKIKVSTLTEWLNRYPQSRPKERENRKITSGESFDRVKPWACQKIAEGIRPPNRNKQWFSVAMEFALAGYSEDDTIELLGRYFQSDRDFKEREWLTAIRSAFKYAYERKQ